MVDEYTGLIFAVPSTVDIHKFCYDLVIQYKSGEATYQRTTGTKTKRYVEQKFNNQGKTIERQLPKGDIKSINYHIKVNGQLVKNISAKPNKIKGMFRKYELNTTIAGTKKDPNTIKKVLLDTTEVGWIIIEEHYSVKEFLRKIYKYEPTNKEENIFRANNPHLTGTPVLSLQPGDFVILSNTANSNNSELQKIKQEAKEAKVEFDKVKKEFGFNSERFARNIDFLHDVFLSSEYVALTEKPNSSELPSNSVNYAAIAAGTSQGIVTFNEVGNKKVTEAYAEIVEAMEYEKSNKTKFANPKNFKLFKKKYAKLFKSFDNSFSQSYFKFNSGIQTGKLRQQIKKNVYARSPTYKGGIRAYVKNFRNMGKVDKFTRVGGNLLVAVSVADATMNVSEAYDKGDSSHTQKTIIKETLKLEGSLGGGAGGALIGAKLGGLGVGVAVAVFGVGTGGAGFIIIGACSAIGGVAGGYWGGKGGENIGNLIYE